MISHFNFQFQYQISITNFNFQFRFWISNFNFDLWCTIWVTRVAKNNMEQWTLATINHKPDLYCLLLARSQTWQVLWTFGSIDVLYGSYPWCVVLMFRSIFLPRILHYIILLFCIYWVCLPALLLASIKNSGLRSGRLCACTWQIKIWCLREILICLLELECT